MIDLHHIAHALGGKVRGDHVVAPGPEGASRKGWKRKRNSLAVWIGDDGDIRVHSHAGEDAIKCKDWVRARAGLRAWTPPRRRPKPKPPLPERNQFFSESLRIVRHRKRATVEQFALIINDMKNALPEYQWRSRAAIYARIFKIVQDDIEAALQAKWRPYSAAERAAIFQTTYDEYRALHLHRSGCAELSPAERRRLTKERYNDKRRAARHKVPTSAAMAARCPEPMGTVRRPRFKEERLSEKEGVSMMELIARAIKRGNLALDQECLAPQLMERTMTQEAPWMDAFYDRDYQCDQTRRTHMFDLVVNFLTNIGCRVSWAWGHDGSDIDLDYGIFICGVTYLNQEYEHNPCYQVRYELPGDLLKKLDAEFPASRRSA